MIWKSDDQMKKRLSRCFSLSNVDATASRKHQLSYDFSFSLSLCIYIYLSLTHTLTLTLFCPVKFYHIWRHRDIRRVLQIPFQEWVWVALTSDLFEHTRTPTRTHIHISSLSFSHAHAFENVKLEVGRHGRNKSETASERPGTGTLAQRCQNMLSLSLSFFPSIPTLSLSFSFSLISFRSSVFFLHLSISAVL